MSGVAVASQFQFVSRTVLQPLGHLVWGNTWWGFPDPCGGTWYRVESGAWKLFLSHFKYILWHMKLKTCWKLKIYIFYKIQYGQVVWPVLYFYQSSAKLMWHSPHRGSSHRPPAFPVSLPSTLLSEFSHFSQFFCCPSSGPCTPFVSSGWDGVPPNLSPSVQEEKLENSPAKESKALRLWSIDREGDRAV